MPMSASSRTAFALLFLAGLLVWISPTFAANQTVQVGLGGTNTFQSNSVTINPGEMVTWHWNTGIHTTTSGVFSDGPNGLWDAPMDAGSPVNFSHTFPISGIYPYYCQIHGALGMTGTVTVGTTSCSIAGSAVVCPNTAGNNYTATIAPSGGTNTFSWTISGNGSIVGSSTSSTVSITSTGAGSFTLTMTGVHSGTAMMCTKVVTVSAPTTCTINGQASVVTGSTGNSFTSTISPAGGTVTRSWTISGNGTITSGTTGTSVTVTAGAPGSFTLTLNAVRTGCPGSCQKIVTVTTPSCTVDGPDPVPASSTGNAYTSTVNPAGGTVTHSWSITGSGTINGSATGASVNVDAGASGSFTITDNGTRDAVAFSCQKVVTIQSSSVAATVTATDFSFTAADVVIDAGQSVKWVWGNGTHTTTNGVSSAPADNPGSLWDAPLDAAHTEFTYQFNAPGYYPYFCRFHEGVMSGSVQVRAVTGVGGDATNRFRLMPAPNPFADKVNLHFVLDKDTRVLLDIFDLGGRKVGSILATDMSAGPHDVTWSGLDARQQPVVPGVYFARLLVGDGRTQVQKLFKSR